MSDDEDPLAPVGGQAEPDEHLAKTWATPADEEDELVDYLVEEVNTVEDLLLEMKDVSELAVDLAYSSLLYDSEDIAEEVNELEETLDLLKSRIQRRALDQVAKKELSVDQGLAIMRLANASEVISDAAAEIADVVLRDIDLHPVLASMIRESDAIITRGRIHEGSFLAGSTIGSLRLESETGMRVIAIKRGATWKYGPDREQGLEAHDILVMRGPPEGEPLIKEAMRAQRDGWD